MKAVAVQRCCSRAFQWRQWMVNALFCSVFSRPHIAVQLDKKPGCPRPVCSSPRSSNHASSIWRRAGQPPECVFLFVTCHVSCRAVMHCQTQRASPHMRRGKSALRYAPKKAAAPPGGKRKASAAAHLHRSASPRRRCSHASAASCAVSGVKRGSSLTAGARPRIWFRQEVAWASTLA